MNAMKKRVLIVVGHPRSASLCHALAKEYAEGAAAAGAALHTPLRSRCA